ncbi:MAG: hypothetical protein AABX69_03360 [Nanoarchaeota archaeon]
MAVGFHSIPSHVAQNIIVGLDFDGTIAYGAQLRVWYARRSYGVSLTVQQILGETWPKGLGKEKYRQMADAVDGEYMTMQKLAPGCKEVLTLLHNDGFRFAVVTSRAAKLIDSAVAFVKHHALPITYFHATDHSPKDYLINKLHARAFLDDGLYNLTPFRCSPAIPFFIRQDWNVHEAAPPKESSVITVASWQAFSKWMLYLKAMHEAICYFNTIENAYYNLPKIAAFWKNNPKLCLEQLMSYRKKGAGAVRAPA